MTDITIKEKLYELSQMMILVAMSIFSLVILVLNRLFEWESWMFAIVLVELAFCWMIRLTRSMPQKMKFFVYNLVFLPQLFYFSVKISSLSDITLVVILFVMLFVFTQAWPLIYSTLLVGYAGMIYHLLALYSGGMDAFDLAFILRSAWQFLAVLFSFLISREIVKVWNTAVKDYQSKIDIITEENNRANNFLANVSHEIRTPINAVLGLSSVLKDENLPVTAQRHVHAISDAGHRIAEQISDILDFTEIDMKKLTVNNEPYMLTSLVNDLLIQVRHGNVFKTQIVIDMEPELPSELVGDASKIKKILWHLIMNGLKYTKEGGLYVRISSIKRSYGVNLVLEVTDTGCGIVESELDTVCKKFYQSDSGQTRSFGGLGLGLSIVNGFTRAMDGFVSISSTVDFGTSVRVSIPQKVVDSTHCLSLANNSELCVAGFLGFMTTSHPRIREFYGQTISHLVSQLSVAFHQVTSRQDLEKLDTHYHLTHIFVGTGEYISNKDYIDSLAKRIYVAVVADSDFTENVPSNISLIPKPFYGVEIVNFLNSGRSLHHAEKAKMYCPGLKVLVVDDEPMNLFVARGIFEKYRMEVSTASSGFEAIDMCSTHDYDLIFMDYMMPQMDGTETMKRLRVMANEKDKALVIVALTANATSSAKDMFLSEGFDGFVPKPIDRLEMERVLRDVLPKSAIIYETESEKASAAPEETAAKEEAPLPVEVETKEEENSSDSLIDRKAGLNYCQYDLEFYKSLLLEYAKNANDKVTTIEGFFKDKNWHEYAIKVHAIKSTSKMIGADSLSEQARLLEEAAKKEDENTLLSNHEKFITTYKAVLDEIRAEYGTSDESAEETEEDDDILEFSPEGE